MALAHKAGHESVQIYIKPFVLKIAFVKTEHFAVTVVDPFDGAGGVVPAAGKYFADMDRGKRKGFRADIKETYQKNDG